MNKTIILLLALAILAGTYFTFIFGKEKSTLAPGDIAFAVTDTSAVTAIEITRYSKGEAAESIVMQKLASKDWSLNDKYRALDRRVERLLGTMQQLEVGGTLSKAGQEKAISIMDKNHLRVNVYNAKGKFKSYRVGPQTKQNNGTIMQLDGVKTPYIIIIPGLQGYLNTRFAPIIESWRENLIFNATAQNLAQIKVTYSKYPTRSFSIQKQRDKWQIQGLDPSPEQAKVEAYIQQFPGKVYGETFATEYFPGKIDSLQSRTADIIVEVKRSDKKSYQLNLFERLDNANNYWGYVQGQKELITVQHFVIDPYLKISGL